MPMVGRGDAVINGVPRVGQISIRAVIVLTVATVEDLYVAARTEYQLGRNQTKYMF